MQSFALDKAGGVHREAIGGLHGCGSMLGELGIHHLGTMQRRIADAAVGISNSPAATIKAHERRSHFLRHRFRVLSHAAMCRHDLHRRIHYGNVLLPFADPGRRSHMP